MFDIEFLENNKIFYLILFVLFIAGVILSYNLGVFCGGKGDVAYYYIVDAVILFILSIACIYFSIESFMRFSGWLFEINKGLFVSFISLTLLGMLHFIVYFGCNSSPGDHVGFPEFMVILGIAYSVINTVSVFIFVSEN